MDRNQINLELAKLFSNEYGEKHKHYWQIYFRFLYAQMLILGIFVFGGNDNSYSIRNFVIQNKLLISIIFSFIIIFLGLFSSIILLKETTVLYKLGGRYVTMLKELGYPKELADISTDKLRWEKKKTPIRTLMVISNIAVSVLSVVIIMLLTFLFN